MNDSSPADLVSDSEVPPDAPGLQAGAAGAVAGDPIAALAAEEENPSQVLHGFQADGNYSIVVSDEEWLELVQAVIEALRGTKLTSTYHFANHLEAKWGLAEVEEPVDG